MTLLRRPRHDPATGWFTTIRFVTTLWTWRGIEDYLAIARRWGCSGGLDPDGNTDNSRKAESKEIRSVIQWFFPRRENLIFWPEGALSLDLGPFDG